MTFDPKRPDTFVEPGSAPRSTSEPRLPMVERERWRAPAVAAARARLNPPDPLADAIDRLTLALTVAVPVPAQRWTPSACPKCKSHDDVIQWHASWYAKRSYMDDSKPVCGRNDLGQRAKEHLHVYCQVCHFNWTEPLP